MSETPGVPPQPGSAQLERLQQLDRRIAQTVGQLIGSLQDEVDRRLNEATGELQRLFEKMKLSAPDLPGAFLQPEDLSELMPPAPAPVAVPVPVPVRVSLNDLLTPLLAGLARIDGESGQAPILKALLEEAQRFASRAAFLLIRGGEIRGWAAQGLPEAVLQQTNFATFGGAFTRLLSADGTVILSAAECAEVATALGVEAGWSGVLVPFQIRGQLAGGLYADRLETDSDLEVSALQVLAYGAAQALETSQLRKGSSSALRLGAGEQLPASPSPALEVTAPVAVSHEPEPVVPTMAFAATSTWVAEPAPAEPAYAEPGYPAEASAYEPTAYEPTVSEPAASEPEPAPSYQPAFTYEAAPAAPSYEAPSYAASSYETPAAATPSYEISYEAPSYEAPSYDAPTVAAPAYEAPSYEAPSYEAPSYEAPSYEISYEAPAPSAPAYETPSYDAAAYETPAVTAPIYEIDYSASAFAAPAYEAPAYDPPAVEAPSYEISYEAASYEAPSYEPPAMEAAGFEVAYEAPTAPSYEIAYPTSFDVPAPAAFEVPSIEPAAPGAYEPTFEMADEPSASFDAAPSYEVSYEAASYEASYEPANEPSSFDTTFEPAAAAEVFSTREDVRFAREAPYELPSEEEIALEKQPEPALEDTNIWEAEEEEDDEPTQIGQSTAAVQQVAAPAAPAPVAAPPANLGQQTVRLDISQLQSHATQLAQERYGEDTADVRPPAASAWQAPAAAPSAFTPTYASPASFATPTPSYDQSEAPTMLGRAPAAPAPVAAPVAPVAPPPSPAGFAGPAPTEQAPGGFGAGGFGAGEAKEAGGSTEVRPPADLVGPGLAFASQPQSPRPGASAGVEETLREEARRLARLLVSEIKLYNEEIIEEGRRSGNIYDRLKDDIDRSRQMYEERIDPRLTDQEDYFYQELVQRLAGGDVKLLGL